jgi:small-conductance mechanosensitive channel
VNLSSLLRTEVATAMAVALVLGLALLALRPRDRTSTRNALVLLVACALAEFADSLMVSGGARTVAGMVADVASVAVGAVLIRLSGILLFRVLLPAVRIAPARIVEDLVTAAVTLAWALAWLRMAGVDLASLITTSAVITAVIAFSMQETLGNVLGGVVLQLDQSIRVGDWVKVDDVSGRVVEIRWRHTAIETRNRETVVVPNGWLVKNRFTVIGSRADAETRWRRWVHFDVDIGAPPPAVCEALVKSVTDADIANVARDPAPTAVLMSVGNGFGRYALRYFLIDPQADDPTDSQVRAHALAALKRGAMALAVTREERLIIKDNESHRAAERAEDLARRKAALAGVALFAALSDAERGQLAEHLVYAPFVKGDTITRQGAVAHWLYLIISGQADVCFDTAAGRTQVSTIMAGEVFGEMGMLTGEPRHATVIARTNVECYRLDKAGFQTVLHTRPDIAGELSRVLVERENDLAWRKDAAAAANRAPMAHEDVLARIRGFFGLGDPPAPDRPA